MHILCSQFSKGVLDFSICLILFVANLVVVDDLFGAIMLVECFGSVVCLIGYGVLVL